MREDDGFQQLRYVGAIMPIHDRVRDFEFGIWRFAAQHPILEDVLALWCNIKVGDMVMPWPMTLSNNPDVFDPKGGASMLDLFRPEMRQLFIIIKIDCMPHSYRFSLLPASGGDTRLVWFNVHKKMLSEVLLGKF